MKLADVPVNKGDIFGFSDNNYYFDSSLLCSDNIFLLPSLDSKSAFSKIFLCILRGKSIA